MLRLIAPLAACALAAALWHPVPVAAHQVNGHQLTLAQRDVRVYNNFGDPTANDNFVPEANFPGQVGAPLAIWKASAEWGSLRRGDGEGDPHQPGDLGSGRANFDATFQGLTNKVESYGANVHSEISGGTAGVYAFAELGSVGGWRIRYYGDWTWDDGPGVAIGGVDLQSVATHEYGHALGLGHSSAAGATMLPTITLGSTVARSIEADDIAGLQAIYGAASATKPVVSGIVELGATIKIVGQNFAPTGNEVWFTSATTGGAPLVLPGVPSPNGFDLYVQVPAGAQPGDLLVKRPGSDHAALSNAWPFDPTQPQPCAIALFGASGSNALQLKTSGVPAVGTALTFQLTGAPTGTLGLAAFSTGATTLPVLGGIQLLDPQGLVLISLFQAAGPQAQLPFTIPDVPGLIGKRVFGQAVALDPGAPFGLAFSNGVEVLICGG